MTDVALAVLPTYDFRVPPFSGASFIIGFEFRWADRKGSSMKPFRLSYFTGGFIVLSYMMGGMTA
ncbi:hypothetical protein TYRP_017770 [Tyrophagus putrescentiae]|nr:hypothetical protein TYRP_017770 [Tyrophagus putrescentiae]